MPFYLVKYLSVFSNVAVVPADSKEEAEQNFQDADFFQKHMGEIVLETTLAEEDYPDKLREEGYW